MEREKGFEPSTLCLGSRCSTPELLPPQSHARRRGSADSALRGLILPAARLSLNTILAVSPRTIPFENRRFLIDTCLHRAYNGCEPAPASVETHSLRLLIRAVLAATLIVGSTMLFLEEIVVTGMVLAAFYVCVVSAVRRRFAASVLRLLTG